MPQLTFEPYTSTKTSILFLQKKTKQEIELWNTEWANASNEYSKLKTRVENLLSVYAGKKSKSKLPSIRNLTDNEEKQELVKMLKNHIIDEDLTLSARELATKYLEELKALCKYDKDTVETFGYVNTWWVFGEVAKVLSYDIFMAEADNIGYKRTKRGEKPMPNDLYRVDTNNAILVDDGVKKTILDFMRELDWE